MARKKIETLPDALAVQATHPAIAQDMAKSGELVLGALARAEGARQLATRLQFDDSLNPEVLWARMQGAMRRTVEETIDIGRTALLLKAQLPPGEFGRELENRGVNRRVMGKYMQAAAKFYGSGEKLAALPGMTQTKLLELVMLDDADAETLAETGAIPGLPTDAVECMSVSELKAALRERDARLQAKDTVIGQMNTAANKLREAIATKKPPTPEFLAEEGLRDLDETALQTAATIETSLRGAIVRVVNNQQIPMELAQQAMKAAVGRVLAAIRQLASDGAIDTTGNSPEARDEAAEDAAIWSAVQADLASGDHESAR